MRSLRLIVLALFVCAFAGSANAQEPAGWSYQLAHDIMSPFCPGLSLSDCPSPNAGALREWIIEQEAAGVSKAEVESQLLARWGDQLLQAPRPEGLGLLAYAIPIGATLLGAGLVAVVILRRRDPPAAELAPSSPAPSPAVLTAGTADDDLGRVIDSEIEGA